MHPKSIPSISLLSFHLFFTISNAIIQPLLVLYNLEIDKKLTLINLY